MVKEGQISCGHGRTELSLHKSQTATAGLSHVRIKVMYSQCNTAPHKSNKDTATIVAVLFTQLELFNNPLQHMFYIIVYFCIKRYGY